MDDGQRARESRDESHRLLRLESSHVQIDALLWSTVSGVGLVTIPGVISSSDDSIGTAIPASGFVGAMGCDQG